MKPLSFNYSRFPQITERNLLFFPNDQLCDYAQENRDDGRNLRPPAKRAECVAELFVREFLKKGRAKKEIDRILTDGELAVFRSKIADLSFDSSETGMSPLDVLWNPGNDFSRICELKVRKKLKVLCEGTDGFIPVYLENLPDNAEIQSFFIPFHFEKIGNPSEKGTIVDLSGCPVQGWESPYARLFPNGEYQCIVHCDQSAGVIPPLTGNSLMLPLYLAFLRKEGKLEYNPLRLVATGEIDDAGQLKSVETEEKAGGFHACFGINSFFVYPESMKYSSSRQNEIALPKMDLDQVEEFFRAKGLFVRAKQDRSDSFCSIFPPVSKFFVGRWEELMRLNKLIDGHIPVITGEAGMGKTELAVAYAYRYAENFPQGRFLIPMQGVHSWADAMVKLVEMCDVHCQTSPEQLGLPEGFSKLPPDDKLFAVYRMLVARAKKGALLILLDNLEDLDLISEYGLQDLTGSAGLPPDLYMMATTRLKETIAVQMPRPDSRRIPVEIGYLKERDSFDLFGIICGDAFAFTKYPMVNGKLVLDEIPDEDCPNPEKVRKIEQDYKALKEIIRLLKCHVWSLEVVAGRLEYVYRNTGKCYAQKELNGIRKKLLDNLQWKKTYRNRNATATSLLQPTFDLILKQDELADELGQKIMQLGALASFFPPEQIPEYALRGFWSQEFNDEEIALEQDGVSRSVKAYDYALTQLKTYRIISGEEPMFKMHRLTREVLQNRLSEDEKDDYIVNLVTFFNFAVSMGVESETDSDSDFDFDSDIDLDSDPESDVDFDWDSFSLSLPKAMTAQQLQPVLGWVNEWWEKAIAFDFFGPDFILNLVRECLKVNLYLEAEHLLSFDYSAKINDKSFFAEYYEIKGQICLNQKQFEKAAEEILKSADYYRELMQDQTVEDQSINCVHLVRDLRNLSLIHHVFGRDAEAEEELNKALEYCKKTPECDTVQLETMVDLINLDCDLSRYDKAEKILNDALELNQKAGWGVGVSSDSESIESRLFKARARVHFAFGLYTEAESELNEALDHYNIFVEDRPEEYYPYIADVLCSLAKVHHKLGMDSKAEDELHSSIKTYLELSKNNPTVYITNTTSTLNALADLYRESNQCITDEEEWQNCLAICHEHVLNHPKLYCQVIVEILKALASLCIDSTRFDKIELELSSTLDIYRELASANPDIYNPDLADMLDSIADVHEKLGRNDAAGNERAEALEIRRATNNKPENKTH